VIKSTTAAENGHVNVIDSSLHNICRDMWNSTNRYAALEHN